MKYPTYLLIDGEIPVKIVQEDGDIVGYNWAGYPYPPVKAMAEGVEIDQLEFKRLSKALAASE